MKGHVLFVHGGGEAAYEEDRKLAASLRKSLGPAYDVRYPKMPNEERPEYEAWEDRIANELAALDSEVILVGHSIGAWILLKYLSEETVPVSVAGTFLLAPPYIGAGGWEVNEDTLREDLASTLAGKSPMYVYHSRDDEVVPFEHLALYAERLPRAVIHGFDGRGHQFDDDLSDVARDIKKL